MRRWLRSARDACNRNLDGFVRPQVKVVRHDCSAFKVCGYTGLAMGIALAMVLVLRQGLSPVVQVGLALSAVATFLALAMSTKVLTGEEKLVYYHHEIAVILVAALWLWLFGQPVLPYLDATLLGVGMFLTCGRVGCLMAGCCHGRPWRWGVCYRQRHAESGFTPHYLGVRLFPIQGVESLTVLAVVAAGGAMVWTGEPPGTALAFYVIVYDIARFTFELARGDPQRPYWAGFSEAQWTSILLMVVVVALELGGALPWHPWHAVATACMGLVMAAIAVKRRLAAVPRHLLRLPRHVQEVAETLESTERGASRSPSGCASGFHVTVGSTSLRILISGERIDDRDGTRLLQYSLSSVDGAMSEGAARTLARIIRELRPATDWPAIIAGGHGVYHLLLRRKQEPSRVGPGAVPGPGGAGK